MGVPVISVGLLAALGLLLLAAGIEDARRRTISNWTNAAVALLAPAWWWTQGYRLWPDVPLQLLLAAVVLGVFAAMFALNAMGGGDVKLIAALALWLPGPAFTDALFWFTVMGGALTALMIGDEWVRRRAARPRPSPIGLALVAALAATAGVVDRRDSIDWLAARPMVCMTLVEAALVVIGALLMMGARAARRRGISPETPYGVAIAAAGLLALREPIINQFA